MRVRHGAALITGVCAVALGVVACERGEREAPAPVPVPAAPDPMQPTDWFIPSSTCQAAGAIDLPAPGSVYALQISDASGEPGSRVRHTVIGNDGVVVESRSERTYPAGQTLPDPFTSRRAAGFLAAGNGGVAVRDVSFASNPTVAVFALKPGDETRIGVVEQSILGGVTRSIEDAYEVELLGCGSVRWSGGEEPVKVFRASTFTRAFREGSPPTDMIRRRTATYYVSPRLGLPMREVEPDATLTLVEARGETSGA